MKRFSKCFVALTILGLCSVAMLDANAGAWSLTHGEVAGEIYMSAYSAAPDLQDEMHASDIVGL